MRACHWCRLSPPPGGGGRNATGLARQSQTLNSAADKRAKSDGVPRWGCPAASYHANLAYGQRACPQLTKEDERRRTKALARDACQANRRPALPPAASNRGIHCRFRLSRKAVDRRG